MSFSIKYSYCKSKGQNQRWNASNDPIVIWDSVTYLGSVDYGSNDSSVVANYFDGWSEEVILRKNGSVRIPPVGYNLAVDFYTTDTLSLEMAQTSLGAGTAFSLIGVKQSN